MGDSNDTGPVLALSGGIGGAKLALGLYRVLQRDQLVVVANNGDDFEHLGLTICPDIDTLLYTLSGLNDSDRGWGRANETWTFMQALQALDGDTWFRLGDGDLATHVERTRLLAEGFSLSEITDRFRRRFGIEAALLPMSDDPVRTQVETPEETLDFQHYFVRLACKPRVTGFRFAGSPAARPNARLLQLLEGDSLQAVVVCPSNPFISIDPILALPGVREALRRCRAPVIAVSPIIGGKSIKGPTDKMMRELGLPISSASIAQHYGDFLDGLIVDEQDGAGSEPLSVPTRSTRTLMLTLADRKRVARSVLSFAQCLRENRS